MIVIDNVLISDDVIEKKFGIDEMMNACEVFLTSSTLIIRPVFQINGQEILGRKKVSKPSLAKFLKDAYEKFSSF